MIFHKCKKCGSLIWFWQNKGTINLELENGKKIVIHLCFNCGVELLKKSNEAGGGVND